jgi:Fe-S-cluster containining protein
VPAPPPCRSLGRHCRELAVTLRIADLEDDTPAERDALATWLLGHRERVSFGTPYTAHGALVVHATLHVPCRHLRALADAGGNGRAPTWRCDAHGYTGSVAVPSRERPGPLRLHATQYTLVHEGTLQPTPLTTPAPPKRALPVLSGSNPCATAPCRTADNTRGAACCRDLTVDVVLPLGEHRAESLLRARKPPYLCKVHRTDEVTVEAELISACSYLEADGVHCGLHGLVRPDGHPAKPMVCSEFPDLEDDEMIGHPGCAFLKGT